MHAGESPDFDSTTTPLLLVVPCYNERERLDLEAFTEAIETMSWLALLFVDDGSTDATHELLAQLAEHPSGRISSLQLERNVGKAEAVRKGLQRAMKIAPICGFWDADLASPLSDVAILRRAMMENPGTEWVLGIRLKSLGRDIQRRAVRHYLGRVFATFVSFSLDIEAYDTQCGAKLFRSSELLRAVLHEPFLSKWIFDVEMLVRARRIHSADLKLKDYVLEQPLSQWHHKAGSKVRPSDFVRALVEVLNMRRAAR